MMLIYVTIIFISKFRYTRRISLSKSKFLLFFLSKTTNNNYDGLVNKRKKKIRTQDRKYNISFSFIILQHA